MKALGRNDGSPAYAQRFQAACSDMIVNPGARLEAWQASLVLYASFGVLYELVGIGLLRS